MVAGVAATVVQTARTLFALELEFLVDHLADHIESHIGYKDSLTG